MEQDYTLSGGVGIQDILPGVDFVLMAGGMFEAEEAFDGTATSVASYWIGAGITWRFGRGACEYGAWNADGSRS